MQSLRKSKRAKAPIGPVLVTGANGRLGLMVVKELARKKVPVRAVILPGSDACAIEGLCKEFYEIDLSDASNFQKIRAACRGTTAIAHLAGLVDYSASPSRLMENNFFSTSQLASAAQCEGVKRFVFVSSTSIYRGVKLLPGEKISEKTPPRPQNAYGESKLAAENALRASFLEYVILRPPIVYGPGFQDGFRQVVGGIRAGKLPFIGSGSNCVAFIHANDLSSAVVAAISCRAVREEFIVTSGESFTQAQLFEAVAAQVGTRAPSRRIPRRIAYLAAALNSAKSRLLRQKNKFPAEYVHTLSEHREYDISKARALLKFVPKVKFASGLAAFIASLGKTGGNAPSGADRK
ncbi:MAG: NAD-dependent epimerase/dehydratase family protein [Candidatus Micrarchaeota archaeon]